jgi:hypothetical protein
MDFTPCGCQTCEARRIEHPPLANGCPCPECQPGPGLDPIARREERLDRILGPLTSVQCFDWCPTCQHTVRTTSRKTREARTWQNTCERGHTWRSFD